MFSKTASAILFFLLSLVVVGQGLGYGGFQGQKINYRSVSVEIFTVTEVVFLTVTGPLFLAVPSSSVTTVSEKHLPSATISIGPSTGQPGALPMHLPAAPSGHESNPYKVLVPLGGSVSVVNSCDYAVFVKSEGHDSCDAGSDRALVGPQSNYTEKIRYCTYGGISLKVSKTENMQNPLQFEYTIWADRKTVSYDISFLDCLKNGNGEKDISACPGQGTQAMAGGGGSGCANYFCKEGEWCAQQAYVVAEFDYKPDAPVGACAVDQGLAFELCAGNH